MRNILIFGSNRGIGLALVNKYLQNKDHVWAICRKPSAELEQTEAEILSGCDFTRLSELKSIESKLSPTLQFDIIIYNAGIMTSEDLFKSEEEDFDQILHCIEVNSIAPLKAIRAFYNRLTPKGKIGLISSRMGSISDNSSGGSYSYRMSKAALNCAGKSLALDLPDHPVALLHPGYVKTAMTNFNGLIEPEESANGLFTLLEKLDKSQSGLFWHANGEQLPW